MLKWGRQNEENKKRGKKKLDGRKGDWKERREKEKKKRE